MGGEIARVQCFRSARGETKPLVVGWQCCKFQMQTSLSPSVCGAFLGFQIEKAVDELNLPKKIISCHPSNLPPFRTCVARNDWAVC